MEESAHRIRELRQEREALLRHKVELEKRSSSQASEGIDPWAGEFFTLYQMVEPMGVEPTTS